MSKAGIEVTATGTWTGLQQMLRGAKTAVDKFGTDVSKSWSMPNIMGSVFGGMVGGFGFNALASFIQNTTSKALALRDMTEQFELGAETIQRWEEALGRAGVSMNLFYRGIETLRSKRAEAQEGKGVFTDIGLQKEAQDLTISDEDLLKLVLNKGSRSQITELLGRGASRLKAGVGNLDESNPVWTDVDLENLEKSAWKSKAPMRIAQGVLSGAIAGFTRLFDKQSWIDMADIKGQVARRNEQMVSAMRAKKDAAKEEGRTADNARELKQLEAEVKKEAEGEEKLRAAQDKLKAVKRQGMKPNELRADQEDELARLKERIKYYDDVEDALGNEGKAKLTNLRIQEAELENSMRKGEKPMGFTADSLAKVGLYSASSISYNPVLNVQQQQLQMLTKIERHTAAAKEGGW